MTISNISKTKQKKHNKSNFEKVVKDRDSLVCGSHDCLRRNKQESNSQNLVVRFQVILEPPVNHQLGD